MVAHGGIWPQKGTIGCLGMLGIKYPPPPICDKVIGMSDLVLSQNIWWNKGPGWHSKWSWDLSLAIQDFSFKNSFLFRILVLVVIEIWLLCPIHVTEKRLLCPIPVTDKWLLCPILVTKNSYSVKYEEYPVLSGTCFTNRKCNLPWVPSIGPIQDWMRQRNNLSRTCIGQSTIFQWQLVQGFWTKT